MNKYKLSLRTVFALAAILSLFLIYPVLWLRVFTDPLQRTAADFMPFYAAGRIALTHSFSMVYDWEAQRQAEDEVVTETIVQAYAALGKTPPPDELASSLASEEVNPFPHPPFILPLLALLARLDYQSAFVAWCLLMLCLGALASLILVRLVPQARRLDRVILFCGTLLFFPLFYSLLNGQDTALLLLAASIWLAGLVQEKEPLAGVGLALTAIRPHLALMLTPPFLFRQRRVFLWASAGAGLLVLGSLLLEGRLGALGYLRMLAASANSEGYKFFNENLMVNLIGLLRRLFPALPAAQVRLVGWIGFGLAILSLCGVWLRSRRIEERHIGLAVILTMFASPHFHYHDLALLLIPTYALVRVVLQRQLMRVQAAVIFPLGTSVLLFIGYLLIPPLKYVIPYLLEIILLAGLWFPEKLVFWRGKDSRLNNNKSPQINTDGPR